MQVLPRMRFEPPVPADDILMRTALCTWLNANAAVPLRYVVGQPGSGKTNGVAGWAARQERPVRWIDVPRGCTARELLDLVAAAITSAELPDDAPLTLVLDDVDGCSREARAALGTLYMDAPDRLTFVYIARAAAAVDVAQGERRGIVAVSDDRLLRFSAEEIALFAEFLGVACTPAECIALLRDTGGWAFAAAAAVVAAAQRRRTLAEAFARWLPANELALERLVALALRAASPRDAQDFLDALTADHEPPASVLRGLARAGLFVERVDGRYGLNVVVSRGKFALETDEIELHPLVLELFGRFRVLSGGQTVRFMRRREAQIVQYLALRDSGRATRVELIATFWPDTDPQLGAQGLRTACSAIRRAIGEHVGAERVDRYFFSSPAEIGLRFAAIFSSAHRFQAHAALAIAAEARDAAEVARMHWAAALRLYTAPVLAGEPVAWWIDERAASFDALSERARRALRTSHGPAAAAS